MKTLLLSLALFSIALNSQAAESKKTADEIFNSCIKENLYQAAENLDSYDIKTNIKQIQDDLKDCKKEASTALKAEKKRAATLAKIEKLKKSL